jgi:Tfp pilus assembly protein PilF
MAGMAEMWMRITSVSVAAALTLVCASTSLSGQRPDSQIDPRSTALLQQGRAALSSGDLDGATGLIESALVIDPRNREAFVTLAQVAARQDLPGKSIRLYREALVLEPNDPVALKGEGEALVQKGAVARARDTLAKLRVVCGTNCPAATELAATIAKGPPVTATAQQAAPTPGATPTTTP